DARYWRPSAQPALGRAPAPEPYGQEFRGETLAGPHGPLPSPHRVLSPEPWLYGIASRRPGRPQAQPRRNRLIFLYLFRTLSSSFLLLDVFSVQIMARHI